MRRSHRLLQPDKKSDGEVGIATKGSNGLKERRGTRVRHTAEVRDMMQIETLRKRVY